MQPTTVHTTIGPPQPPKRHPRPRGPLERLHAQKANKDDLKHEPITQATTAPLRDARPPTEVL
ncbi:hypothetical protein SCLCIDRAFT_1212166, partial [Scleroderma citrinum Foug A]